VLTMPFPSMFDFEGRARHPEYGTGRVEGLAHDINGTPLAFIRWDDTRRYGVAGGWYAITAFRVEPVCGLCGYGCTGNCGFDNGSE